MTYKKKTAAVLLGLTLGMSGSVFAAPAADGTAAADQDLAARIAAIEAQQQELTKQLSALKKENAKLKRTSKVAESNRNAIKGLKEAQERVQLHGFGRASWTNDNIKGYIDRNDNSRYYLDLQGSFKVNDKWSFNFQSETNQRYKDSVKADGTIQRHNDHDDSDGVIQRIWATGRVGAVDMDLGRKWRGFGFQNVFIGNETDGVLLSTPIPKSKLTGQAFVLTPTDKGYDFTMTGVGVKGQVGHGLQLQLAAAKTNIGKNDRMGTNYYDGNVDYRNTAGTFGYMASAMWNPVKNIFLIGDYVWNNAKDYTITEWKGADQVDTNYNRHDNIALRVNYRWSNIDNPGSFQIYGRWFDYAKNINNLVGMFGDKEWGNFQAGSRGWVVGFKYVPAKNIEWETYYQYSTAQNTLYGHKNEYYKRKFITTQIDYHF